MVRVTNLKRTLPSFDLALLMKNKDDATDAGTCGTVMDVALCL